MGRMMQTITPMKYYDWYFKFFSYISIPLLALFWVGILYRIQEYSFTQSRVYLVAAGALMTVCSGMLLSKKFGNYRLITFLASGIIIVLTYIPGISAKSMGLKSQQERLEKYITELNMRDQKSGKLIQIRDFKKYSKAWIDKYKEMLSSYYYVKDET